MKLFKLLKFSHRLLKGKRARTAAVCMLPVAAELFFRFAEAAIYAMLLYFRKIKPIELFNGRNIIQLVTLVSCTVMRWIATAPFTLAAAYRLTELADDREATPVAELVSDGKFFRRSLVSLLIGKLIGTAAVVPSIFFGRTALALMHSAENVSGTFLTIHAAVLTAVSVGVWLSVKISLAAVPFILAEDRELGVFRAVIKAFRIMLGRKTAVVRLTLICLPLMLVAFPAAFTLLSAAFSLLVSICLKEDEYCRTETFTHSRRGEHNAETHIHGRYRFGSTEKLSPRTRGSLTQTPHRAEKA